MLALGLLFLGTAASASAELFAYDKYASAQDSPDGWNLWLTDETGSGASLSPHLVVNPALDSSGGRVVFANHNGYYVAAVHSDQEQQVSTTPAGCDYLTQAQPQWTPDDTSVLTDASCHIQLVSPSGTQWQSQTLINWPGKQMAPTMSPDGTRLAFLSNSTPDGTFVSPQNHDDYALFMTDASGANPVQLTDANFNDANAVFPFTASFSPEGTAIAFEGYDNNNVGGSDSEIYTLNLSSGIITQLTEDNQQEWGADWLRDGRIAFASGADNQYSGQFHAINRDGTGETNLSPAFNDNHYIGTISGPQPDATTGTAGDGSPPPSCFTGTSADEEALLKQYTPQLRYDAQETFFADSVGEMTDFAGAQGQAANDLKDSSGSVMAGHGSGFPLLSLNFLGPTYPLATGPRASSGSDYVDAEQTSDAGYSVAANWMRENPQTGSQYANKAYGRLVCGSSKLWIQYWLFYYDNPFSATQPFGDIGVHEGDWEEVQIGLDPATLTPQTAVYSEHSAPKRCPWSAVPKANVVFVNGSPAYPTPISYVAAGSHANFFTQGSSGQTALDPITTLGNANNFLAPDQHNGNLLAALPDIIDITDPPSYIQWPGHWGSSDGGFLGLETASPQGPESHSSWSNPDGWAQGAGDCPVDGSTATSAQSASPNSIAAPTQLTGTLENGHMRVNATLPSTGLGAATWRILLTVQGTGSHDTPVGGMFDVSGAQISHSLPIPRGPAPYVVRASLYTAQGLRSKIVSTEVPSG